MCVCVCVNVCVSVDDLHAPRIPSSESYAGKEVGRLNNNP